MKETLHNSNGLATTDVKRAFGWVFVIRSFPAGATQTVDGPGMLADAVTLITKGKAEVYLDGQRRLDRGPGFLTSDMNPVGREGDFEIHYVEPTTRVCVPAALNKRKIPNVTLIKLEAGEAKTVPVGSKLFVALGEVTAGTTVFAEETSFTATPETTSIVASVPSILMDFTKA